MLIFSVILSKEFIIYIVSFRMVGIRLSQSLSMIANDWNLINILENWHLFTNGFLQKKLIIIMYTMIIDFLIGN